MTVPAICEANYYLLATGCCAVSSMDALTVGDTPSRSQPLARDPLIAPQPDGGGASPGIPGELAWAPFAACPEMDDSDSVARRRDNNRKQSKQAGHADPAKAAAEPQCGGSREDGRVGVDPHIKEGVETDDSDIAAQRRDRNRKRNGGRKHAQPAQAAQPVGVCSPAISVPL
jgi:hypothetical protein